MTAIRTLVQVSLVAASAAVSFATVQVYMAAHDELRQETSAIPGSDKVVKLSDNGDHNKALSPIFPTTKYAHLPSPPVPVVKKPARAIVASHPAKTQPKLEMRSASHMPMQLAAYNGNSTQRVAYGYAPEPQQPRAASIFGQLR